MYVVYTHSSSSPSTIDLLLLLHSVSHPLHAHASESITTHTHISKPRRTERVLHLGLRRLNRRRVLESLVSVIVYGWTTAAVSEPGLHGWVEVVHGRCGAGEELLLVLELLHVDGRDLDVCGVEDGGLKTIGWEGTEVGVHTVGSLHAHAHVESRLLDLGEELVLAVLWGRDVAVDLAVVGSRSWALVGVTARGVITAWPCTTISSRESNLVHQALVSLSRLSLES